MLVDQHIGYQLVGARSAKADRWRLILARHIQIDKAVIVEVGRGDVFESGARQEIEFRHRQPRTAEHLCSLVLPVDPAYQVRRAVLAELGDDTEGGASRDQVCDVVGGVKLAVALDEEERWRPVVEACLGPFEQIELAVPVRIEHEWHARTPKGIRDPGGITDILEMVPAIDEEAFRLRSEPPSAPIIWTKSRRPSLSKSAHAAPCLSPVTSAGENHCEVTSANWPLPRLRNSFAPFR